MVITPVLIRQFAWDITPCPDVPDLLTALGLTHGSEEGQAIDHAESHQRLERVQPLQQILLDFSEVLGAVVTTAMTEANGITDQMARADEDGSTPAQKFAEQNAEVIFAGSQSVIAHLMSSGILQWGPSAVALSFGEGA
jgi:hypothetical protein